MSDDFEVEFTFQNKRYRDAATGLQALGRNLNRDTQAGVVALRDELLKTLNDVAAALAKKHSKAWPGGTTPTTLARRSGNAMASIPKSIRVSGDKIESVEGHIGGAFYLRIHEMGGTIKAKRGKWLTIPLPPALNSNGTPKKIKARQWSNTFIGKSRKGNLIIFQKRGRRIVPLYVLKRSVKIPARLGMRDELTSRMPAFVERAATRMLQGMLTHG